VLTLGLQECPTCNAARVQEQQSGCCTQLPPTLQHVPITVCTWSAACSATSIATPKE
jgi:hypothetical protein